MELQKRSIFAATFFMLFRISSRVLTHGADLAFDRQKPVMPACRVIAVASRKTAQRNNNWRK